MPASDETVDEIIGRVTVDAFCEGATNDLLEQLLWCVIRAPRH